MDDVPVPITDHLTELRRRVGWSLLTWLLGAVVSWTYAEEIFAWLLAPAIAALAPDGGTLQAIAPTEIFFTYLKCALLAGFFLALPVLFWQVWAFVAPGLYAQERRAILPFALVSTLLFGSGALFGYSVVFPIVFEFFNTFASDFVQSAWTLREVFSLTTHLFLAFGIAFELPVFVFFLSLTGIVTTRQLLAGTPYAVLAVFITSALITPPDVISQILLAVPMLGLYLIGIGVSWLIGLRRDRRRDRSG